MGIGPPILSGSIRTVSVFPEVLPSNYDHFESARARERWQRSRSLLPVFSYAFK